MYIFEKKSLKMTSLNIQFYAGGLFDKEGQRGTSHLMEHLICKTFDDLLDTFTNNNIAYNAYTSVDYVVFWFNGLNSRLTPDLKRTLVKRILGGLKGITKEAFENERATVVQEYLDYFNDPSELLNSIRQKYNYYDALGVREEIENFTYEDMFVKYKELFSKPHQIIEVGPEKTDFSDIEYQESFPYEPQKIKYKKCYKEAIIESAPESSDKKVVALFSKKPFKKADYPFVHVINVMLSSGLNSPMYDEIRNKRGLSYGVRSYEWNIFTYGHILMDATSTKPNELIDCFKMFTDDITKWLTKERFNDVMNMISAFREKNKILRYANINDLLNKGYLTMPKNLNKITFDKLIEVAKKYYTTDNFDVVVR